MGSCSSVDERTPTEKTEPKADGPARPVVLVLGATGRCGRISVKHLADSGQVTVRAAYRKQTQIEALQALGAHEVVEFKLDDDATWPAAVSGIASIVSLTPDKEFELNAHFANFLSHRDGIKHVVRISCFGLEGCALDQSKADRRMSEARGRSDQALLDPDGVRVPLILERYWWSEETLRQAGIPTTSIRCGFFMNHQLKNDWIKIAESGWFTNPLGNQKNAFVSTVDVGAIAAQCILEGPQRHAGQSYSVTGPEPMTMADVAGLLSQVMNRFVFSVPQELADFEKEFGSVYAEFIGYVNGRQERPDFESVMGRPPMTYMQYLTVKGCDGTTGLEELFSSAGQVHTRGEMSFAVTASVQLVGA